MAKFSEIFFSRRGESDLISDKWSSYLEVYDKIFEKYSTQKINIAEIGVQNGGSLEVYNKYFSNAEIIIGIDNNEKCKELSFSTNKIKLISDDATNKKVVSKLNEYADKYNIIIDDGSHTSEDIIKGFSNLFALIKNDGVYVVEDMHTSYFQSCNNGLYAPYSANTFFKLVSDIVNYQFWNNSLNPSDILNSFKNRYKLELSDDDLLSIKSVSFYNSLCVIEKGNDSLIGKREFSGSVDSVVQTVKAGVNVEDIFSVDKSIQEDPTSPELLKLGFDDKLRSMKSRISKLETNISSKNNQLIYFNNFCKQKSIFSIIIIRLLRAMYFISSKIFRKRNPMNFFLRILVKFNLIAQETIEIHIRYE